MHDLEEQRKREDEKSRQNLVQKEKELEQNKQMNEEQSSKNQNLKAAFNADRKVMQEKVSDLERKLTVRTNEIAKLENKIHMLLQGESSQKNELNFWNGKVSTLKRDLEYQQTFSEKMQEENAKLQADVDNLRRELALRDKDLNLSQREAHGLKEDNERLNRMYQLVQKEAFNNLDKLKKTGSGYPLNSESTDKKDFSSHRNEA